MTDPWCENCQHRDHRYDAKYYKHYDWCNSPQVHAAHRRAARCIFERDSFHEPDRGTPDRRKCGPDHLNYIARVD